MHQCFPNTLIHPPITHSPPHYTFSFYQGLTKCFFSNVSISVISSHTGIARVVSETNILKCQLQRYFSKASRAAVAAAVCWWTMIEQSGNE